MRFKLLYKKQPIFGLDIGNTNVKMAQIRRAGRRIKLLGYGMAAIPQGAIVEGIISDPEAIAEAVRTSIHENVWGKISAHAVAAALPESRVFTRIIKLPQIDERQLEEAINYETQQYIPMPIDDIYIDHQVVGQEKDKTGKIVGTNILLVAAPRAIVDSYNKFFEALGVMPKSLEISLSAIIRATVPAEDSSKSILVADLGSVATDIAIVHQTLRVTASVPIGGVNMTAAIAKDLKIETNQAEEVKCRFGIVESGLQSKLITALSPAIGGISSEMKKMIKFYEERGQSVQNGKVSQIILSGGGASLPGLAAEVEKQLGLPTSIGNPWANLTIHPLKPIPKTVAPIYSTAIGLSLLELKND